MWQIIFKCIHQGSKYDIYNNLSILSDNAKEIDKTLFNLRTTNKKPELYLYDVTSSYFEEPHNEYAKYDYNRDKKSGKLQLVIGLLTDDVGTSISATVFDGNTNDTKE